MTQYLVCYDIEDNRERDRVFKLLCGYGDPVQRSVFEIRLRTEAAHRELMEQLAGCLSDPNSVRIYPLCANCRRQARTMGGEAIARWRAMVIL